MDKVGRPKGLIRYASLEELEGKPAKALFKRPRVWVYGSILLAAWSGIIFGLTSMDAIQLKVLKPRIPKIAGIIIMIPQIKENKGREKSVLK